MPGFDLPWRLLPETKQAISRGLDHFEETGKATWTKLQRGLVEAGTAAMNAVAMSGATSQGFSPAAAMYQPMAGEDVGTELGASEAFSQESLAREDALGPVASVATDLVAGIPTAFAGGAGAAADVASAKAEAERAGMGPMGQAATTLLAGAPIIGAGTAKKLVREIGGGTAKAAQDEFKAVLNEAATVRPSAMGEGALKTPADLGEPSMAPEAPLERPTLPAAAVQTVPAKIDSVKQNQEGLLWYEKHMRQADPASGDAERFMSGLSDDS